jgi:hypothetical protein
VLQCNLTCLFFFRRHNSNNRDGPKNTKETKGANKKIKKKIKRRTINTNKEQIEKNKEIIVQSPKRSKRKTTDTYVDDIYLHENDAVPNGNDKFHANNTEKSHFKEEKHVMFLCNMITNYNCHLYRRLIVLCYFWVPFL